MVKLDLSKTEENDKGTLRSNSQVWFSWRWNRYKKVQEVPKKFVWCDLKSAAGEPIFMERQVQAQKAMTKLWIFCLKCAFQAAISAQGHSSVQLSSERWGCKIASKVGTYLRCKSAGPVGVMPALVEGMDALALAESDVLLSNQGNPLAWMQKAFNRSMLSFY